MRRFCVSPSERFMLQLKEFEPIYRAKKNREFSNYDSNNSKKRSLQDTDLECEFVNHTNYLFI